MHPRRTAVVGCRRSCLNPRAVDTPINLVVQVPPDSFPPAWWIAERLKAMAEAYGCEVSRMHVGVPADKGPNE